jgi:YVTN family beta-propeller protein
MSVIQAPGVNDGFPPFVVINPATNAVIGTIATGSALTSVAVTPDGSRLYVTNSGSSTVSVIDTATSAVIATIVTAFPAGLSITPDGSRVYVANSGTRCPSSPLAPIL